MLGRFSPIDLLRGHFKGLSDYRTKKKRPDKTARAVLVIGSLAAGGLVYWSKTSLAAPGATLAGVALLAGGFLASFTHLSVLRLRLTEREDAWGDAEHFKRDALDETVAHLLLATYLAGITAFLLVLGMNFGGCPDGSMTWGWTVPIAVTGTYMSLLFLIAIPRLYAAYVSINRVRDELSGTHRGETR